MHIYLSFCFPGDEAGGVLPESVGAMGSASSDLEQSSSVSGEGSATRDDAEEERSSSDHGGEGTTTTSAPPGGLFLKRSLDDDFANNNRDSEQDADGESRTAEGLKEPAAATSAANENNKEPEEEDDMEEMETDEPVTSPLSSLLPPVSTNLQNSNVGDQLKEQLQKISMTISQLSNSIANNSSPKNVQELAVLQATLFSLQQQQLLQMQILSQMQQSSQERSSSPTATAASSKEKEESPAPTIAELAKKMEQQNSLSSVLGLPEKQPGSGTAHSRMKDGEHGSGNSTSSVLGALGALAAGGGPNSTPLPPSMPPKPSPGSMLTGSGLAPATSSSGESNKNNGLPMSRHQPPTSSSSLSSQILDPNAPPSLASSIIIHHDDNSSAPPAVNSLELLQQRAQGILNNASQGLLANNLADFSVSKDKDYERKGEPFFKHRCRYCGKVFGSDSALQIHVRSHTGERPYKCNICGNRFTTKGNLKVHFQRHSSKFPNIKMNPNLVPEHLDKFYPPLLQQIEDAEKKGLPIPSVNNPMAGMTPIIPPGLTLPSLPNVPAMSPGMGSGLTTALTSGLVTPPGQSSSPLGSPASIPAFPFPSSAAGATTASTTTTTSAALAAAAVSLPPHLQSLANLSKFTLPTEPLKREEMPQNLSKGERSRSVSPMSRDERMERMERMAEELKRENNKEEPHSPRSATIHVDDEDEEEVESRRAFVGRKRFASSPGMHGDDEKMHKDSQEEPENLTKSGTRSVSPPRDSHHHLPPGFPGHGRDIDSPTDRGSDYSPVRMPFGFPGGMFHGPRGSPMMPPSPQGGRGGGEGGLLPPRNDPAKDPNVYTNLLPRPGSNDNAWESLIEVNKASETTKLEQLVNTIEHKLSDPNECVICHRVLSCKSALQMHYRTHTGERPFKCRICGRAFTTKGNLKTHMGVHRAKPPMRMFHQCPVCHKKYANALVLQQHIKTHTGEPTELTTEQIAAAEIRDFPPLPFPGQFPGGFPGLRLPGSGLFPGLPAQFAHGGFNSESQSPEMGDREDIEGEEKDQSRPSSVSSSTSSMKNASFPSFPGGGNLPTSIPSSLANLESLVRSNSEMMPKLADHRPFSLVRPFLMDKQQQQQQIPSLPEDLSSPIRKPENGKDEEEHSGSPVSPPKYSPEPPVSPKHHGKDEEDRRRARSRSRERNGGTRSPKTPSSSSPDVRPLALDLTPRPGGLVPPPTSSAAPGVTPPGLTSMFGAGFPGLIPPPGLGNPLLGGASVSALNQLNALANPVFNPLMGLPFPHGGLPGQIRCEY